MDRRVAIAWLLTGLLVITTATSAWARSAVALGYTHDPAGLDDQDPAVIDATIERIGSKPALWTVWSNWGSRGGEDECLPGIGRCAFPSAAAAELMARDITPFVWWQPVATPGKADGEFSRYVRIIRGAHDDYIRQWAADARDHGGPILLRFAHEMNGRWYPWSLSRHDNSPKRFIEAWRHIWHIFQEEGATNVRFVWSPSREDCKGCEPNHRYETFYPGNRYVDYVGLNAYNSAKKRWRPLATTLERPMARLREVTESPGFPRGKPVILGEVGSTHGAGDKAQWISEGYDEAFRRWPRIRAIAYFDVDMRPRNPRHPDWRLSKPNDGSALVAYQEVAAKPRFRGQLP